MGNNRIAAIVISAGYSSRMGSFKPLLKFGEYTAVETIVNMFKASGIDDIIVVVGHRGHEVAEKLADSGVKCVLNENFSQGMFTSIQKGLQALDENTTAFFMLPVDIPLVKKHTVEILKNKYLEYGKGILYPSFCGKKGHPPLIDTRYKQAILNSDGEGGLKKILAEFTDDSFYIPVFDESVLMDMDTKEDYEKLLKYFNAETPNRKECYTILRVYNVPDHIIKHCTEVTRVALDILDRLKSAGYEIDKAALEAAALLHDIARREKNHASVGEAILKEIGYEHIGNIISTHIDIEVNENEKITENEILYLADKLVKEDRIVKLEDRLQEYLEKNSGNIKAIEKINIRFEAAGKIVKKIEKIIGKGFTYG